MAKPDLSTNVGGIKSPNPFWLASGPPTNSAYQVRRAFEAGWGGVVWKTLGTEPIVNVSSRYGALNYDHQKMVGLNNIELITDRTLETNLAEIRQIKREFPHHAVVASLMVESKPEVWHDIVRRTQDTGCDGLELNFGCPHGMSERGMGAAVGQIPEYTEQITTWVKEAAEIPVLVKLTPNVTDVRYPGRAAKKAGADGIALINTINSIIGVDLDNFLPIPNVAGRGSHGGFCGPAVKPIALHMVQSIAADPEIGLPISGIGGIQTWRDAVEFLLLGANSVQVCTAAMHYGFRIVEQPGRLLRQNHPAGRRLEPTGPQLQGRRPDRPGQVRALRPLLHSLRRRCPPVDKSHHHHRRRVCGPLRRRRAPGAEGQRGSANLCRRR